MGKNGVVPDLIGLHEQLIQAASSFPDVSMALPAASNVLHPSPRPIALFQSVSLAHIL